MILYIPHEVAADFKCAVSWRSHEVCYNSRVHAVAYYITPKLRHCGLYKHTASRGMISMFSVALK